MSDPVKNVQKLSANSTILSDMVEYHWHVGCTPTAVAMVVGYWDRNGYDGLISGDSSYYSEYVRQAMASEGHMRDYFDREGYSTRIKDESENGIFGTHENDSIADFLYSSRSALGLNDGWTKYGYGGVGFHGYATSRGYDTFTTSEFTWSGSRFDAIASEIDAGRPVLMTVDSGGKGYTDHSIVAFGYDKAANKFLVHDGWERTDEPRWIDATGVRKGQEFGIGAFTTVKPSEHKSGDGRDSFLTLYDDGYGSAASVDGSINADGSLAFEQTVANSGISRTATVGAASADGHTIYRLLNDRVGYAALYKFLAKGDGTYKYQKISDNSGLSSKTIDFATANGRDFYTLHDDGAGTAALYISTLQTNGQFTSQLVTSETGFHRQYTKGFSTTDGINFQLVVSDGGYSAALYETKLVNATFTNTRLISSESGLNLNTVGHVSWETRAVVDDTQIVRDVVGTDGDDYLTGSISQDRMFGGNGNDVFYMSANDDVIDGQGGDYNQVDFDGKLSDYAFKRNGDGSVTVSSRDFGQNILRNIHGLWFAGEAKWYALDEAVALAPAPGEDNIVAGTDSDDYLKGTAANDTMLGGDGVDVFVGSAGDDVIDGQGGEYNQVDYRGAAGDYTFTRNADGSITVVHGEDGTDTLRNIDGFWFMDEAKWYAAVDLAGPHPNTPDTAPITGTAGNDYLQGTDADDTMLGGEGQDVFVGSRGDDTIDGQGGGYNQVDYRGAAGDYAFTRNPDGSITVVHGEDGTDTLRNIDGFWFMGEAKWYAVADLVAPLPSDGPITGTDGDDYLHGTDADDTMFGGNGRDVFVGSRGDDRIDGQGGGYNQVDYQGSLADYDFSRNDDGTVSVSHAEFGKDVLTNIDGFWFMGEEVWYSLDDALAA